MVGLRTNHLWRVSTSIGLEPWSNLDLILVLHIQLPLGKEQHLILRTTVYYISF